MSVASHPDPTPADPYPAPAHPPEPPPAAPAEPVGVPSAPSELPSEGEPLGVPPDLPSEIPSSPARPQSWASSYRPPGQSSIVAKHRMPGARGADVGHRGSSDHRRGRPGDAKPYRAADARGLRPVLVPPGLGTGQPSRVVETQVVQGCGDPRYQSRVPTRLTLCIEPCAKDPSRFNWTVRHDRHILLCSLYSLPNQETAQRAGRAALQDAATLWQDSH